MRFSARINPEVKAMNKIFGNTLKKHVDKLKMYVPVVDRVHGKHHPEFHTVRQLTESILDKSSQPGADLSDEFAKLRETTNNYTVPDDVCETFEAVYKMLAELDRAYHE